MNRFAFVLNCLFTSFIICLGCGVAAAAIIECKDKSCFIEQAANCEKNTSFLTPRIAGGQVRYSIMGPYKGGCDINMNYTRNPNPDWVGLTLRFVIDPGGDIDAQIKSAVAGCLEGKENQWLCEGSLFDKVTGVAEKKPEMFTEPVAAASPPCGVDVVDDGPPLYPMLNNGKWGYVTRDGEWAIEPRWFRAEPFSEGRAAVNMDGRWGVIDRAGDYVLGPVLPASSREPPLKPFSQGCATATTQKDGHLLAFFVSRAGEYWLYHDRPAALGDLNIWEFGDFSGGRAWFEAMDEGLKASYGWIDNNGKVVLEDDFSSAGNFVDGLAPAVKGDRWTGAYIDMDGNPVMPDRWKYGRIHSFSEGRGAVEVKPNRWMYFNTEGALAISKVILDPPREVLGKRMTEAEIGGAGEFHDGLAPVNPKMMFDVARLIYIHPDGTEAFSPDNEKEWDFCQFMGLPEFRDGLLQLLIVDKGEECNGFDQQDELLETDKARYVYLDTSGKIVLQQEDTK